MSEPKTKYGNKITIVDGITFASKREAKRYGELKHLKNAGIITNFIRQPVFEYLIRYMHPVTAEFYIIRRKYIADFQVIYPDGRSEIEDVKGTKTAIYKQKKKIIETLYKVKIIEK